MKRIFYLMALTSPFLLLSCGNKPKEIKPERRDITEMVYASGVLTPENQYNLTAQTDGYLVALNFEEGNTVKTGDLLAVIENRQNDYSAKSSNALLSIAGINITPDAPAIKQAEATVTQAERQAEQDQKQAERYRKLYENKSVSKVEYENAQLALENSQSSLTSARENLRLLKQKAEQELILQKSQSDINNVLLDNNKIRAVLGGRIYKKYKQLGDYVKKGEIIAEIGNADQFYAKLNVDENNISKIKTGQSAVIQLNVNKEKNYRGIVSEIYPSFDEQTQSFYCKALFSDSLDFKISGTLLQSNIIITERKNVLVIPRSCLDYGNKVKLKGKKDYTTIQTGFISTDWVEVVSGIDENTVLKSL